MAAALVTHHCDARQARQPVYGLAARFANRALSFGIALAILGSVVLAWGSNVVANIVVAATGIQMIGADIVAMAQSQ